jgi:uncharacterized BrkB/YihY/UPF0761 family membrane protein
MLALLITIVIMTLAYRFGLLLHLSILIMALQLGIPARLIVIATAAYLVFMSIHRFLLPGTPRSLHYLALPPPLTVPQILR